MGINSFIKAEYKKCVESAKSQCADYGDSQDRMRNVIKAFFEITEVGDCEFGVEENPRTYQRYFTIRGKRYFYPEPKLDNLGQV